MLGTWAPPVFICLPNHLNAMATSPKPKTLAPKVAATPETAAVKTAKVAKAATATASTPNAAPKAVAKAPAKPAAPKLAAAPVVDTSEIDNFFKKTKTVKAPDATATAEAEDAHDGQGDTAETQAGLAAAFAQGPQRCGLIAIVGKPNVGKSTLLNALVGQKISITSRKAQTTRHRILGIRTEGVTQCVFADTPGFQTIHGNALNKSLNKTVSGTVSGVDLVLLVVEAGSFTPADAKVLKLLGQNAKVILIANKFDTYHRRAEIAPWLQAMQEQFNYAEIIPMSAKNARDIERLLAVCEKYLPEQPWIYGEDELTDRSEKFMAAEMVREKLFRLTGDELPYTSTVVVDQFSEEPGKTSNRLVRIAATLVVERDGHKAMVIGEGGERLKRIGMEARIELERLMDAKVFLQLWVKVRGGWADNAAHLKSYGYE
jgi:GTPase